ncbi:hypothetical protein [Streptomyces sp. 8P21H-1]|uniref:hypothetical protein n=1 Tax=Streptomyces sp. 8P21H-1 TaxID=2737048 RepID=UPI00156E87D6|nr:hypothetical protein [Streptomyces sp. 8P21H-1]NSL43897.1 hypothetical protein [Streptomyces sp. 8P21H-1]
MDTTAVDITAMDITTTTRVRRLVALVAIAPLVAACGAGHHGSDGDDGDDGSWAAGARPVLSRGADLVISTDGGVRLRPADSDRAGVDRHVRHTWSHRDGTWLLDLSCPARGDRADAGECPRMPAVEVPADTSVTVSARNAGIDVAGVSAALRLTTVNGDVTVTGSGRPDAAVRLSLSGYPPNEYAGCLCRLARPRR